MKQTTEERLMNLTENVSSIGFSDKFFLMKLFKGCKGRTLKSRKTISEIAKEFKLSEATIRYHIRRLKKADVIEQVYVLNVEGNKIEMTNYKAVMKLSVRLLEESYFQLSPKFLLKAK